MATDRKSRTDAWYSPLSDENQARIYDRMKSFPWYKVSEWIKEEYKLDPPSRSALYRFREWFADHEAEFILAQRLKDMSRLECELKSAGAPDAKALAKVLGNDVVAARANRDDKAVERAVRLYTAVAKVAVIKDDIDLRIQQAREKMKTDIERGLDALQAELQGNSEAMQLYCKLRETVMRSVGEAAA